MRRARLVLKIGLTQIQHILIKSYSEFGAAM
jgi:hypothetical protein